MRLDESGSELHASRVGGSLILRLKETLFQSGKAGTRCLLDHPLVQEVAFGLRQELVEKGHLPSGAVAIQAIAFDKTPETNWKVTWHQDLMFPFARPVASEGFDLSCVKEGIAYARPPLEILEKLLAVRLHLDDCDETNGPLKISPGTHRLGIIDVAAIPEFISGHGQELCLADEGVALLMRPLLLHSSSRATAPKHRRVLHLVFAPGDPMTEEWHRRV
ncbi:MAG: phytanoyl-CoA dioxygenase [Verrucomicrobiales bacterium VVV1]|nr:MAG: phytanoyl-CoA dioxygenase [Verrucomicrobiales bacterium VVV1]